MNALLTRLKEVLPARLPDGRAVELGATEASRGGRITALVRGPAKTHVFFTVEQQAEGYILEAAGERKHCAAESDLVREVQELPFPPPYQKLCWNCGRSLVQNPENICPKCLRFVLCECGNCVCDNPQFSVAKAVPLEGLLRIDGLFTETTIPGADTTMGGTGGTP